MRRFIEGRLAILRAQGGIGNEVIIPDADDPNGFPIVQFERDGKWYELKADGRIVANAPWNSPYG